MVDLDSQCIILSCAHGRLQAMNKWTVPITFRSLVLVQFFVCPPGAAHVLTAEEAEKHSIHDIVMPLPGFDVIYPTHHG